MVVNAADRFAFGPALRAGVARAQILHFDLVALQETQVFVDAIVDPADFQKRLVGADAFAVSLANSPIGQLHFFAGHALLVFVGHSVDSADRVVDAGTDAARAFVF